METGILESNKPVHLIMEEEEGIVSLNPQMRGINRLIYKVAAQPVTILIVGESGTGKELVARHIYQLSARQQRPFVALNMAAIPGPLLESILFGHEKGAFTGAHSLQRGRFELADGGTLFLDEIGELPLELQPKLLRALQEGEIERVGGGRPIPVNVRLIAATNRNLSDMVKKGTFRADLYYRLHVVTIKLPPLRERKDDMPLLIKHFMARCNRKFGKRVTSVSDEVMKVLLDYSWPGNIRELENLFERIIVTADASLIGLNDLPPSFGGEGTLSQRSIDDPISLILPLDQKYQEWEKRYLQEVLKNQDWHQGKSARLLGIHRKTLEAKMKKYGLVKPG